MLLCEKLDLFVTIVQGNVVGVGNMIVELHCLLMVDKYL